MELRYYLETQISGVKAGSSRYGRFDLVCPFYNRETEGESEFLKFVELSCGIGFLLTYERGLARLRMLLKKCF